MWAFLTTVRTEIEADILIGLLDQDNIPTRKIYPGIGNLKATYGIISGVEIYVPKDLITQAKDLLDSISEKYLDLETEDPEDFNKEP